MIDIGVKLLMNQEVNRYKNVSIVAGIVTEEGKIIEGQLYDDLDVDMGDAYFEIGSATKTFTSLLLAKLVTEGTISLDDPISKYKPEYKNALSYNGKDVTFRNLASHSSRLPREDMKTIRKRLKEHKEEKNNPYKYFSHDDLHQFYLNHSLRKEIGKKWGYSNIGVGLLGNTLADILNTSYEQAIKEHILEPLEMNDTFIKVTEERLPRYVKAYDKKGKLVPPIELDAINGAGAIKSTINDMLTYLEHQIGIRKSPLEKSISLTHESQSLKAMKNFDMGIGWMIESPKWSDYSIIQHGGTTIGFHTYCGFMKEPKIGIVIFSTVQVSLFRLLKMITNLEDLVNSNIANRIFQNHLASI